MTNYEKIMNEMTIEKLARINVKSYTSYDWNDEYEMYRNSLYEGYITEEQAIEDEIEWLKEKVSKNE